MSTAPSPARTAALQLATLSMHTWSAFGFAVALVVLGTVLLGRSGSLGPLGMTLLLLEALAFYFLGMAVKNLHAVLRNQEERLARLEEILAGRGSP